MQCAEECREEMGGRPEDVPRLVYVTEQQACPDFCVLDRAGMLDEEGRPNVQAIKAFFKGKDTVQKKVGSCRRDAMGADKRGLVRFLAKKFPEMDRQMVAEEFRNLTNQDKRTVVKSVRLNMFDDCLGKEIAIACPNEE